MIREAWIESGQWLTADDRVAEHGFWRVVILLQLQSASVSSVRLQFEGVRAVAFDPYRDVSPAVAKELDVGWRLEVLSCQIVATTCTLALLDDDNVGRGPFLSNGDLS
jgi:hypothetical protein